MTSDRSAATAQERVESLVQEMVEALVAQRLALIPSEAQKGGTLRHNGELWVRDAAVREAVRAC